MNSGVPNSETTRATAAAMQDEPHRAHLAGGARPASRSPRTRRPESRLDFSSTTSPAPARSCSDARTPRRVGGTSSGGAAQPARVRAASYAGRAPSPTTTSRRDAQLGGEPAERGVLVGRLRPQLAHLPQHGPGPPAARPSRRAPRSAARIDSGLAL